MVHLQISKQWILPEMKIIKSRTKEYFPERIKEDKK
jgi:hypothetical protein